MKGDEILKCNVVIILIIKYSILVGYHTIPAQFLNSAGMLENIGSPCLEFTNSLAE